MIEETISNQSDDIEVRAFPAPWYNGVQIMVRQGKWYGVNVTMKEIEPGLTIEPTLHLNKKEAQVLMDDLWASGFRPTEGTGSAGSLRATERHLKDMRRIALNLLGMGDEKKNDKNS